MWGDVRKAKNSTSNNYEDVRKKPYDSYSSNKQNEDRQRSGNSAGSGSFNFGTYNEHQPGMVVKKAEYINKPNNVDNLLDLGAGASQ